MPQPIPRYGTVPADAPRTMSGIEILRAMMTGELPLPTICEALGFALTEVEDGRVTFTGTTGPRFMNPYGTMHGGFSATLLDSALACAIQTQVPVGFALTTLEFKLNFLRGYVAETGPVRAIATVLNVGRRVGTSEARLVDAQDRLLVHATSSCLIMELPAASGEAPPA